MWEGGKGGGEWRAAKIELAEKPRKRAIIIVIQLEKIAYFEVFKTKGGESGSFFS